MSRPGQPEEGRRYGTGRGDVFPASASRRLHNPLRHLVHPPRRLVDRVAPGHHEVVLELGCGPGWFSAELSRRAPGLVIADLQPEMLALARGRVPMAPILCTDATRLPVRAGSVDAVVLAAVLGEVPTPQAVLDEVVRVLRPEGRLVVFESWTDPDRVPLPQLRRDAAASGLRLERRWGWPGYTASFRAPALS